MKILFSFIVLFALINMAACGENSQTQKDQNSSETPPISDRDTDGIADDIDNCADVINVEQLDSDSDGAGDLCDQCPNGEPGTSISNGCIVPEPADPCLNITCSSGQECKEGVCVADENGQTDDCVADSDCLSLEKICDLGTGQCIEQQGCHPNTDKCGEARACAFNEISNSFFCYSTEGAQILNGDIEDTSEVCYGGACTGIVSAPNQTISRLKTNLRYLAPIVGSDFANDEASYICPQDSVIAAISYTSVGDEKGGAAMGLACQKIEAIKQKDLASPDALNSEYNADEAKIFPLISANKMYLPSGITVGECVPGKAVCFLQFNFHEAHFSDKSFLLDDKFSVQVFAGFPMASDLISMPLTRNCTQTEVLVGFEITRLVHGIKIVSSLTPICRAIENAFWINI